MPFFNMEWPFSAELTAIHWFADGLKVSSLFPQGAAVVARKDKSHLEVAAQGGPVEVRTAAGDLVARLESGKALSFAIQAPVQNPPPVPSQQDSSPARTGQSSPPPIRHRSHLNHRC